MREVSSAPIEQNEHMLIYTQATGVEASGRARPPVELLLSKREIETSRRGAGRSPSVGFCVLNRHDGGHSFKICYFDGLCRLENVRYYTSRSILLHFAQKIQKQQKKTASHHSRSSKFHPEITAFRVCSIAVLFENRGMRGTSCGKPRLGM